MFQNDIISFDKIIITLGSYKIIPGNNFILNK